MDIADLDTTILFYCRQGVAESYLRDANQCGKFFSHLVLVLQEVVNSPPPSVPARPRKRPREDEEQGPSSKK